LANEFKDEECTFRPAILRKSCGRLNKESRDDDLEGSRSFGVERQIVKFNQMKQLRKDRSTEEIEFEKSQAELTFKP
jgi:hypothetical protein